jgi:hypothetical protein
LSHTIYRLDLVQLTAGSHFTGAGDFDMPTVSFPMVHCPACQNAIALAVHGTDGFFGQVLYFIHYLQWKPRYSSLPNRFACSKCGTKLTKSPVQLTDRDYAAVASLPRDERDRILGLLQTSLPAVASIQDAMNVLERRKKIDQRGTSLERKLSPFLPKKLSGDY